jgi:hypothetical protein
MLPPMRFAVDLQPEDARNTQIKKVSGTTFLQNVGKLTGIERSAFA